MKLSNQDFRAALGLPAINEEPPPPQPNPAVQAAAPQPLSLPPDSQQPPMASTNKAPRGRCTDGGRSPSRRGVWPLAAARSNHARG